MQVVYEDNHIIIIYKDSGEIVQGDKTGDQPLSDTVKQYIKEKYNKPGNVFLGVVHRLDRPVWGWSFLQKPQKHCHASTPCSGTEQSKKLIGQSQNSVLLTNRDK